MSNQLSLDSILDNTRATKARFPPSPPKPPPPSPPSPPLPVIVQDIGACELKGEALLRNVREGEKMQRKRTNNFEHYKSFNHLILKPNPLYRRSKTKKSL